MAKGKWVSWTPHKKKYDFILFTLALLYLIVFCVSHLALYPTTLPPILIIKATGTLAIVILHIILIIGPLTRLDRKFLPLLYNRRHLGVTMFAVSLIHGLLSLFFYHGSGVIDPISSLFTSNTHYSSWVDFPYMTLGFTALLIFAAMAITSHDYWNNRLGPRVWKNLHMSVYIGYGIVITHVLTGALQSTESRLGFILLGFGFILVASLHILAGIRTLNSYKQKQKLIDKGYISIGSYLQVEKDRAKIINHGTQSIAVFRHENTLTAISNYCKHQGGPLGEGKIVDGCITCPWHGYQYYPQNGTSPPPFEEKVPTYNVELINENVFINPTQNLLGANCLPCSIPNALDSQDDDFYIGWSDKFPKSNKKKIRTFLGVLTFMILIIAFIAPRSMETLKDSTYQFTAQKRYTGVLLKQPVPILRVIEDGVNVDHLLVNLGKKSALPTINAVEQERGEDLHQHKVSLTVTEMQYKGRKVLELTNEKEAFLKVGNFIQVDLNKKLVGEVSMKGEIVDPKCFFGAMNPGEGKVHRSCAVLCIKGGIPAVLAVGEGDNREYFIIKGANGEDINIQLLNVVGEDVQMKGSVYSMNNWKYIHVDDIGDIKRLSYRSILEGDGGQLCSKDFQRVDI